MDGNKRDFMTTEQKRKASMTEEKYAAYLQTQHVYSNREKCDEITRKK